MKATSQEQEQPFKPIKIEIVIESEAELHELYVRMRLTQEQVSNAGRFTGVRESCKAEELHNLLQGLWNTLPSGVRRTILRSCNWDAP